jgi:pre-mRNA-processing factor 19
MDVDGAGDDGMTAEVIAKLNKTNKTLSKGRKKRAKSATLATTEEVAALSLQGSQTGIHSSSSPAITSLSMPTPSSGIVLTGGADKHAVLFDLGNEKEISRMKVCELAAPWPCRPRKRERGKPLSLWSGCHR